MKKLLFIICLFSVALFARNDAIGNPKFLDIEVDDYAAQSDIDRLKDEFLAQSKGIHNKYERRIDKLHEQRKDDIKNLKKAFKRKMKGLKKRYSHIKFPKKPHKIKDIKDKGRPDHKTKPMLKEDANKRRELNNPKGGDLYNKKEKKDDKKVLKAKDKKVLETKDKKAQEVKK